MLKWAMSFQFASRPHNKTFMSSHGVHATAWIVGRTSLLVFLQAKDNAHTFFLQPWLLANIGSSGIPASAVLFLRVVNLVLIKFQARYRERRRLHRTFCRRLGSWGQGSAA